MISASSLEMRLSRISPWVIAKAASVPPSLFQRRPHVADASRFRMVDTATVTVQVLAGSSSRCKRHPAFSLFLRSGNLKPIRDIPGTFDLRRSTAFGCFSWIGLRDGTDLGMRIVTSNAKTFGCRIFVRISHCGFHGCFLQCQTIRAPAKTD